uniref:Uncharacterized protein n=1 Tax=Arundo donax TaxID=35708 RepID=A0A0A9GWB9_ARUDO
MSWVVSGGLKESIQCFKLPFFLRCFINLKGESMEL